jgi:hypothetical protein
MRWQCIDQFFIKSELTIHLHYSVQSLVEKSGAKYESVTLLPLSWVGAALCEDWQGRS